MSDENKSIKLDITIWYREDDGCIRLQTKSHGGFISTVSNDPRSDRYHPELFKHLAKILKEAGKLRPVMGDKE